MCEQTNRQTERHTHVCVNRQTDKLKDIPTPLPAFSVSLGSSDGVGGSVDGCGITAGRFRGATGGGILVPVEHYDSVMGLVDVFRAAISISTITILNE